MTERVFLSNNQDGIIEKYWMMHFLNVTDVLTNRVNCSGSTFNLTLFWRVVRDLRALAWLQCTPNMDCLDQLCCGSQGWDKVVKIRQFRLSYFFQFQLSRYILFWSSIKLCVWGGGGGSGTVNLVDFIEMWIPLVYLTALTFFSRGGVRFLSKVIVL